MPRDGGAATIKTGPDGTNRSDGRQYHSPPSRLTFLSHRPCSIGDASSCDQAETNKSAREQIHEDGRAAGVLRIGILTFTISVLPRCGTQREGREASCFSPFPPTRDTSNYQHASVVDRRLRRRMRDAEHLSASERKCSFCGRATSCLAAAQRERSVEGAHVSCRGTCRCSRRLGRHNGRMRSVSRHVD